jgi:hypothetical protein
MARKHTTFMVVVGILAGLIGSGAARAADLVNETLSFTVPAIGVPQQVCVRVNGTPHCNPSPATKPVLITLRALLSEGSSVATTEGAPGSVADGNNCARLAKTLTIRLAANGSASLYANTTPAIEHKLSGPAMPAEAQSNTVELCVNK